MGKIAIVLVIPLTITAAEATAYAAIAEMCIRDRARAVPFAAGAAAVDGLRPIGDVIGAIVIVSAGAYDLSQPGPGLSLIHI